MGKLTGQERAMGHGRNPEWSREAAEAGSTSVVYNAASDVQTSVFLVGEAPHGMLDQWLGEYVLEEEGHDGRPLYSLKEWQCDGGAQGARMFKPDALLRWHAGAGQWIVGKRKAVGTNQGWLAVSDKANTPWAITSLWHAHVGWWIPAPALKFVVGDFGEEAAAAHQHFLVDKAAAAPVRVRLQGALPRGFNPKHSVLGEYVKLHGSLCDRRPVYKAVGVPMFLRYCSLTGSWMVGDTEHLGTDVGYMMVSNAKAWSPVDVGLEKKRYVGEESAADIGRWKVFMFGRWHNAPGVDLIDMDVETAQRAQQMGALATLAAVVCLALVPLALRWGVRGFTDWRARRRAAARAEKLREKRRERRAVDAEVTRFKRSLRAPSEGCA